MTARVSPTVLTGKKVAGFRVQQFLDDDVDSQWFDATADNGDRAIVYVYTDRAARDRNKTRLHGFRTTADETIQDAGKLFITVGEHRLMMPRELRNALKESSTRPTVIEGYEVQQVLGHGYKGITYEVRRKTGPRTPYALKLTIADEYLGRTYLPEVDRMVDLASGDRDHFPQVHECGEFAFTLEGTTHPLVYFVEDFIRGRTLEHLLAQDPGCLDALFLHDFTVEMLAALATLQTCELMHDDLHSGNVMLHTPLNGKLRPYLIDFGSAKPLGHTKKARDDIRNLASQIAAIANAVHQRQAVRTAYEERILSACEGLLSSLADDDPLRRPSDARDVFDRFKRSFEQGAPRQKLKHPFDFGNAEEVMDNSLLYSLSAKSFPWRDQIEASSHLLVIGPRGCGKTTVFRSLSFKCLADAGKLTDALSRTYVGLYISCNKEFRQRFSALDRDVLTRRQDDIRHYFHMVVLREFLSSLNSCAVSSLLLETDRQAVVAFIRTETHLLDGAPESAWIDWPAIESLVTREVNRARMALWNDRDNEHKTTQGFLSDLATLCATQIGPFVGKSLYIFVDDYTEGKVPKDAQRALNHILFVPNSEYKCKISSEVFGVTLDETYGNFLAQDRDYREWNLGTMYCLTLPSKDQKAFLREIVDTRLALCEFTGRVDDIIGSSTYPEKTLARTLKCEAEKRKEKRGQKEQAPADLIDRDVQREIDAEGIQALYHGWDTVCELCTGDVSNILELLNRMYDECGVKAESTSRIHPEQQNSVIEAYSRQYIAKIKGIPAFGEKLFSIVDAFGHMSRRLLQDYPWIERPAGRRDPYQLLRIEMDEAGYGDSETEAEQIWRLLQRYCIFIDGDESRSRRNTLSSRVIFRRIFCPAFRIGLTNSECLTYSRQQWEAFCNDPSRRAEIYIRDNIERALKRRGQDSDSDRPLFRTELGEGGDEIQSV